MSVTKPTLTETLSSLMALGTRQSAFLVLLARATQEHRTMEAHCLERLSDMLPQQEVTLHTRAGAADYFQKNFFSILFLSLFIAARIPAPRRLRYGLILHALRTIITCADNILDNEQKGALQLKADLSSPVLNNFMLTLMAQKLISQALGGLTDDRHRIDRVENQLLNSLFAVARGEDCAVYRRDEDALKPRAIIEQIHTRIGGQLLQLALVAPLEIEDRHRTVLRCFEQGVLQIGIALQMLDDCVDIAEDLAAHKNNLLASQAVFGRIDGACSFDQLRHIAAENPDQLNTLLAGSRRMIIDNAIQTALDGFDTFCDGGYPIKRSETASILKTLFQLRGLAADWHPIDTIQHREFAV